MTKNLLSHIYRVMSTRATIYSLQDFPKSLPSLTIDNPSEDQLKKDYHHIHSYYRHPVFQNYMPTHDEMTTDYIGALVKRYNNMKISSL